MDFFVTTPIYYLNGAPHIGHAYTSIAADILARFYRADGLSVKFLTGTDEHGIKVARAADADGIEYIKFCDIACEKFCALGRVLCLTNDDFIRTTELRHEKSAQALWRRMEQDIYLGKYSGWYSSRDEEFVNTEDIVDGKSPTGSSVEWLEEECFYFKLSKFQEPLLEFYQNNPEFISPISKKNEIVSFVKSGLKDLSISRTRFNWGIPVPDRNDHVMYVWIDALANYITSLGFPDDTAAVSDGMNCCTHIVGKEILRFHAVYWPAMLMSAGLPLPKKIFAHGWWTNSGQKMSKSVGNVVDPFSLIDKYGLDAVRYFLIREVPFGEDGDFSEDGLRKRFTSDLANDYGNLIQRVFTIIERRGIFQASYDQCDALDNDMISSTNNLLSIVRQHFNELSLSRALDEIWSLIGLCNKYVEHSKPWVLAKTDISKLDVVLTILTEAIRVITYLLSPFIPITCKKVFDCLHVDGLLFSDLSTKLKIINVSKCDILFSKDILN